MRLAHVFAVLSATLGLVCMEAPVRAQTLSVIGAPAKVCQLTGQTDWYAGQATNAQTQTLYGLKGVDLGFPVETNTGTLLFLFGDTVPNGHASSAYPTVPPDDAVGYTTQTAAPIASTCLGMKMFSPAPGSLTHPTVTPAIQQGSFNVPTGGITIGGVIYAFFWTDHCFWPDPFGSNAATPLVLPPQRPPNLCPETAASNSLGVSVMASASPSNPTAFTQVAPPYPVTYVPQMPNGFVYVTAAEPPMVRRKGVYPPYAPAPYIAVFGVARYRQSIPYLALAPRGSFSAFETWSFYAGTGPTGPIWLTYAQWQSGWKGAQWTPPANAEIYADGASPNNPTTDERCVGEHSATWNPALEVWILLYGCGGQQVEARTAPNPWGPWSAPTVVLSGAQNPGLYCTLFWNPPSVNPPGPGAPCLNLTSQQTPALSFGYLYAPFVMNRYTEAATPQAPAPAKAATIYWLLSTWDPYQVTVMQTTLQYSPPLVLRYRNFNPGLLGVTP
jgi:hypothetical protein